jgi:hypothetical protein
VSFPGKFPPEQTPFADVPDPLAASTPASGLALPPIGVERLPGPTRGELRRRWSLALGFCAVWLLGQVLAFGLRANWAQLPTSYLAALVLAPIFAAGLCLSAARARGQLGLGLHSSWLRTWGVLALALPLGLGFGLSPGGAATTATFRNHGVCVLMVLGWSVPPLLVLGSVMQRSFAAQAGLRSAHLAAAAGLLAATLANLHCALVESTHVALAHGLPVTAVAVLGALLIAPRARI